ncbi:solute carrier family 26 member 10-like [Paramacrobiotus metropolitanus]|uniref:solute carrier family 26 member 10-like n=1 Tax=Paramacrobiotus metropolitanus TaxID=2943436 RepID=UPI00244572E3|nr:solute carrier family 26 member 10-like [Paramacrobiotus metropolitanus]
MRRNISDDTHPYDVPMPVNLYTIGATAAEIPAATFRNVNIGNLQTGARLQVNRPVFNQESFDSSYELSDPGLPLNPRQKLYKKGKSWFPPKIKWEQACSVQSAYAVLVRWIPILYWLPKYNWKANLLADVTAGVTVAFLNTPEGVAYALLASVPAITGLYTSFFPLLIFIFLTTTRHSTYGTNAIISVMTSKLVMQHAQDYLLVEEVSLGEQYSNETLSALETSQIRVASGVAFLMGAWQLIFGIVGAGGLVVYFSDQLVQGFTCGAAVHVFSSQLPTVFGIHGLPGYQGAFKLIRTYVAFFQVIHTTHGTTLIVSLLSLIFLIIIKYAINANQRIRAVIRVPIPAELLTVLLGTSISYAMNLHGRYGVTIVNRMPAGFPAPALPGIHNIMGLVGDTFIISVIALSLSITLGLLFANKHGYAIDPNQEFRAQGVANVISSFFQCFPSCVSVACTALQDGVGGRTQVVSMVHCTIILIVIVALGRFLEPLPHACLGAIVMISVVKLIAQIVQLVALLKVSLIDWSVFVAVFFGVVILDVDYGLAIGLAWAILTIMLRMQKPKVAPMGRLPGTDIYQRTDEYIMATEVPGVKIIKVNAPIYYANATYIKLRLYAFAELNSLLQKPTINNSRRGNRLVNASTQSGFDPTVAENYAYADRLDNISTIDRQKMEANRRPSYQFRRSSIAFRQSAGAPAVISLEEFDDLQNDSRTADQAAQTRHLIVDCSSVSFLDVTGAGFLKKTQAECAGMDVEVLLACASKSVREMLYVCGAGEYILPHQYFVTIHDAVLYAVNTQKQHPNTRILHNINNRVVRLTAGVGTSPRTEDNRPEDVPERSNDNGNAIICSGHRQRAAGYETM